jgi:hypothetical protein
MAKASKKSEPAVHHFKSVHVQHLPPAVDLVVGPPVVGGSTEAAPAAAPAKTTRNYQQDHAIALMKEIWPPDGPPEHLSHAVVRQKMAIELGRRGYGNKAVPSRDSIRRARQRCP